MENAAYMEMRSLYNISVENWKETGYLEDLSVNKNSKKYHKICVYVDWIQLAEDRN